MVSGVIARLGEKPWKDKTFWSFALRGQEGWYNTGMKKPPAVGTSISFNEKKNAKGYFEVDGSIEILADGAVEQTPRVSEVAAKSSGAGGQTQSGYWDAKAARDIRNDDLRELGASRNTAINFIELAIKNEAVKLPAAAAKKESFLWDLLDKYTSKLMGKTVVDEAEEAKVAEPTSNDPQSDTWN